MNDVEHGFWRDTWYTFKKNKFGVVGLCIVILSLVFGLFADVIAPYDYSEQNWESIRQKPTLDHIMGTDSLGRDLFSRVVMGMRTAVLVGVIVTIIVALIGILVGAVAGLVGGKTDSVIVWIIDGLMNFPDIWLAAFVVVVSKPLLNEYTNYLYESFGYEIFTDTIIFDYLVVFFCLSMVWWAPMARVVRGQVFIIREKEFILSQRAAGSSTFWIITKHITPNVIGLVIVQMTTGIGRVMLAESALSFLGIGIQPPGASLGNLIYVGMASWRLDPHLVFIPSITLSIIILGFILTGDALNDALNPKIRNK